ncbi:polysaccharide deacetylase family protein [Leptolyngbya sp. FACHB-261]|uniref:polysaccharide deacetylase family protein n=1 Tax=Leptolyngbya sp. FACHB-261 TaxID=2692806 RepID=UPI0016876769|nr:polysaccharide deacetylase family protein [Leptolyngbya sp. FACHB-261]MBD2104836.1 polysaccharide deacetylase family protein [Leptolyngbya sp. FACHB-261]
MNKMWCESRLSRTVRRWATLGGFTLSSLLQAAPLLAQTPLPSAELCPTGTVVNASETEQKSGGNLAMLPSELARGLDQQISTAMGLWERLNRNLAPWPGIAESARMARVPVLMYHDITDQPEVFFDVTPEQFEARLEEIREAGATPISMTRLVLNLRFGVPLPPKPVLLSFDDGYAGHYKFVLPLLKRYNYPATFAVYIGALDKQTQADAAGKAVPGRAHITWDQLREIANSGLATIVAHSVSHPEDLTKLDDAQLQAEILTSKQRLEQELGLPIPYFAYPAGHHDERVVAQVAAAGFQAALTMSNDEEEETFAGNSTTLLAIQRFGQSRLREVLPQAWAGPPFSLPSGGITFNTPVAVNNVDSDGLALTLISGGRPRTFHADTRYQVADILAQSGATAAVDGGFFSLEHIDSNQMIGPVLSQNTGQFIPDSINDLKKMGGRPLVLIGPRSVRYVPFNGQKHNSLEGIQAEMPDVTDAFVAAAWLVKAGVGQPSSSFRDLYGFDAMRQRAFWGINEQGQPVVGVSHDRVDAVALGRALAAAGLREAVMLDSGASTSLAYRNESLVSYLPRPVPHAVTLSDQTQPTLANCAPLNTTSTTSSINRQ